MERGRSYRLIGSLSLVAISIAALLASSWPLQSRRYEIPLASLINQPGLLVMNLPAEVRFRDTSVVRVTFTFEPGNVPQDELLEIRLDFPELGVKSQSTYIAPIEPGQSQKFEWEILAQQRGNFSGTLWMYLTPADRPEAKQVFMSRQFEIQVVDYAGMPGFLLRWSGIAGLLLATGFWLMPAVIIKLDKNRKSSHN